jgi:hypothetical protein
MIIDSDLSPDNGSPFPPPSDNAVHPLKDEAEQSVRLCFICGVLKRGVPDGVAGDKSHGSSPSLSG